MAEYACGYPNFPTFVRDRCVLVNLGVLCRNKRIIGNEKNPETFIRFQGSFSVVTCRNKRHVMGRVILLFLIQSIRTFGHHHPLQLLSTYLCCL